MTILTIIITIIAYQLIIFSVSLADLYDDEKVQLVLCGFWSLVTFIIVRPIVKLYRKCKLHWFNTHYTKCVFYTKREEKSPFTTIFYVKNTEIDKLNQDKSRINYIELKPEEKAKSLLGINIKRNRGSGFLTDLSNPPVHSGYTGDHIAKWLK